MKTEIFWVRLTHRILQLHLAIVLAAIVFVRADAAFAQTTTSTFVLIPYEEPGVQNVDPIFATVAPTLAADLQQQGITAKVLVPMDHMDAIAHAAGLCHDNAASGVLIPEGLYLLGYVGNLLGPLSFSKVATVSPVALLTLTLVGCDRHIIWQKVSRGTSDLVTANYDGAITSALNKALDHAAATFNEAAEGATATPGPVASPSGASPQSALPYLVLPVAMTKIGDRIGDTASDYDATGAFAHAVSTRGLKTVPAASYKALGFGLMQIVPNAATLCAQKAVGSIIIPRLEYFDPSKGGRHFILRVDLVGCDGNVVGRGVAEFGSRYDSGKRWVSSLDTPMAAALAQVFSSSP
jgi:hypothetical protein